MKKPHAISAVAQKTRGARWYIESRASLCWIVTASRKAAETQALGRILARARDTPDAKSHSQQTETKDDRNTHALAPCHFQRPNNPLRQQHDGNVGCQLNTGRADFQLIQVEAFSLNGEIVDSLVRDTLRVQGNHNSNARGDLNKDDDGTSPPEIAFRSPASGSKHATPFDQNSYLERGQNDGIADAKD